MRSPTLFSVQRDVVGGGVRVRHADPHKSTPPTEESKTMPKFDRPTGSFGEQKHVKKIISAFLVATGLGGATLVLPPMHRHAAVAAEERPVGDAVPRPAAAVVPPPAPVVVTKDSNAQDIVKAISSQGRAARLSDDQIKTIIATAKIESSFRPTASGGVRGLWRPWDRG